MVSFLIACAFAIAIALCFDLLVEARLAPHKARLVAELDEVVLNAYDPVTDTYYRDEPLSAEDERELEALGLRWR